MVVAMLDEALKDSIQGAYRRVLAARSYTPRIGQRQMIAQIARSLSAVRTAGDDSRLGDNALCVVEAGTGTGKTLAYLLAAIPIAQASEKTLVIATATVALQEQVLLKDLPELRDHSGLSFNYALAKGRGRYLCLAKLDSALSNAASSEATMALYPDEQALLLDEATESLFHRLLDALGSGAWAGDRDAWPDVIEDGLWRRLSTDHAQCSGRRCPHVRECSFFQAREALEKADVIVANHDLVLADLSLGGGVILPAPEDTIYIFDEAHHLGDKALRHFAHSTRLRGSDQWLEQSVRVAARARSQLAADPDMVRLVDGLTRPATALRERLGALRPSLETLVDDGDERGRERAQHRFPHGVVPASLREQAQQLVLEYQALAAQLERVLGALESRLDELDTPVPRTLLEQWYPAFGLIHSRVSSALALWQVYAVDGAEENPPRARWVAVVEGSGGALDLELHASPIQADGALAQPLWQRCHGAVLTSATLRALGRFERLQTQLGLPAHTQFLAVASPFRYAERAELRLPAMRSDPADAMAHTAEIVELLPRILRGDEASLVLFSSRRQMDDVYAGLPGDWQQRILVQGRAAKQVLLDTHRQRIDAGEGSVLFGLASFAEGIDLPGSYCRHVVIAKIPFAVPDDPVGSAIAEWIEQRGGNPFMEISVPDASLRLIQASGRLLRTETDEGVVSLLDRRVLKRRYGRALLDALPPFRRVIEAD
jgi:ATP-dependent DNA helicase DinG